MHVSSYDWLHPAGGGSEAERLPRDARAVLDCTLSASDAPAVLFPRAGGNIHEFTALTDCAVLDLMSPPYSTGGPPPPPPLPPVLPPPLSKGRTPAPWPAPDEE